MSRRYFEKKVTLADSALINYSGRRTPITIVCSICENRNCYIECLCRNETSYFSAYVSNCTHNELLFVPLHGTARSSLHQSVGNQLRISLFAGFPSNKFSSEKVDDNTDIVPFAANLDVSDVTYPDFVGFLYIKLLF
ncbi:MAG: hypothetical protein FWD71_02695 [Oscillospiraceae bacterium]|nr:hypothetical protein [Oscillospiraceae bacterium]